MKLSVIISTKNSEDIIERALKSVSFADEIVVVDMHSQDKTLEIVKQYTDKFFSHKDHGYIEPVRNFSISKAKGDWILIIDADEEVSPDLQQALASIVKAKDQEKLPDCFYLPRKNIIFKKWIQKTGWWPDYQLRFFRKDHVQWSDQIHSVPITKGEVKEFPAKEKFALLHHNYQSITQFVDRLNNYSSIQSQEKSIERTLTATDILEEFSGSFLRRLFAQEGIEDSLHGMSLSILQSTADAVMTMKIWERQGFKQSQPDLIKTLNSLTKFRNELSYWIATTQIKHATGIKKVWWRLRRKLMF